MAANTVHQRFFERHRDKADIAGPLPIELAGDVHRRLSVADQSRLGLSWRAENLAGRVFGSLKVLTPVGRSPQRSVIWLCVCECGKEFSASSSNLKSGSSTSCGCARSPAAKLRIKRSGGPWNIGAKYQIRDHDEDYRSLAAWRQAAIRVWGASCQVCGWDEGSCDAHHRIPKSQGGRNTILNAVVLCPNHHRIAHEKGLPAAFAGTPIPNSPKGGE